VLMHCKNSPTKVKYLLSGLNITDVGFRDSIVVASPQRSTRFRDIDRPVGLTKLPQKGRIFSVTMSALLGKEWIA